YGTTLEGESQSTIEIQIEQAGRVAATGASRRILWLPEGLMAKEERQQRYLDTLQKDAANEANTDLLSLSIENLKTYLVRKLSEPPIAPAPDKLPDAPLIVY